MAKTFDGNPTSVLDALQSCASPEEALDKIGFPPLPDDLAKQAREMDEATLNAFALSIALKQVMRVIKMAARLKERCGVCRVSDGMCAHCEADNIVMREIFIETAGLARVTFEANKPGTRISAQREAQSERGES
jgi:hypothetical protein